MNSGNSTTNAYVKFYRFGEPSPVDSFLVNISDYSFVYFVNGRGIDRFVGQSSDTIKISVTKSF